MTWASQLADEIHKGLHHKVRGVLDLNTPSLQLREQKRSISSAKPNWSRATQLSAMDQTQQALENALGHGTCRLSGERWAGIKTRPVRS